MRAAVSTQFVGLARGRRGELEQQLAAGRERGAGPGPLPAAQLGDRPVVARRSCGDLERHDQTAATVSASAVSASSAARSPERTAPSM